MDGQSVVTRLDAMNAKNPAVGLVVGDGLCSLTVCGNNDCPNVRQDCASRLAEAHSASGNVEQRNPLAAMVASGQSLASIMNGFVPAALRLFAGKCQRDEVGFDSSFANARQDLSVLMAVPRDEQDAPAGTNVVEGLRGGICSARTECGPDRIRIAELISACRFSLLGVSPGSRKSVERTPDLIDYLRSNVKRMPKVEAGGSVVADRAGIEVLTGADFSVTSVCVAARYGVQAVRETRRHLVRELP